MFYRKENANPKTNTVKVISHGAMFISLGGVAKGKCNMFTTGCPKLIISTTTTTCKIWNYQGIICKPENSRNCQRIVYNSEKIWNVVKYSLSMLQACPD